ncbi:MULTISPECIES: reverse transcriptase domain-containing protein [Streptomyces violaceusniger group]|uniref:reverse transcriptase domain-containing protein n=1 Tax=Streptomyces violaceusniger group TaxID=2839105 RepID=UPI000A3A80A2|nr:MULTISPECIES: reverse transcriptase domain-containing protein [Streptomyces violaceusniger group]
MPDSPVPIRYADDFVVLCHGEDQAHLVRTRLDEWLRPRGLHFNEAKTRVVHLHEGFGSWASQCAASGRSCSSNPARQPS